MGAEGTNAEYGTFHLVPWDLRQARSIKIVRARDFLVDGVGTRHMVPWRCAGTASASQVGERYPQHGHETEMRLQLVAMSMTVPPFPSAGGGCSERGPSPATQG